MKQLKNYTEIAVIQYVKEQLPKIESCQCDNCRLDIIAIMLNNLKPHYVVTDRGALFAQMSEFDLQHRVDFMQYLTEAVKIVNEYPRH